MRRVCVLVAQWCPFPFFGSRFLFKVVSPKKASLNRSCATKAFVSATYPRPGSRRCMRFGTRLPGWRGSVSVRMARHLPTFGSLLKVQGFGCRSSRIWVNMWRQSSWRRKKQRRRKRKWSARWRKRKRKKWMKREKKRKRVQGAPRPGPHGPPPAVRPLPGPPGGPRGPALGVAPTLGRPAAVARPPRPGPTAPHGPAPPQNQPRPVEVAVKSISLQSFTFTKLFFRCSAEFPQLEWQRGTVLVSRFWSGGGGLVHIPVHAS